jgi:hypothetical protein
MGSSGFTSSHAAEPSAARAAATRNEAVHPNAPAIIGVTVAVTAPPICPTMFISPDAVPAERPAMSAVTAQYALWDRYSAPAPPAKTMLASLALYTWVAKAMNTADKARPNTATPQRPARRPLRLVRISAIHPPRGEQLAIARKGSME